MVETLVLEFANLISAAFGIDDPVLDVIGAGTLIDWNEGICPEFAVRHG